MKFFFEKLSALSFIFIYQKLFKDRKDYFLCSHIINLWENPVESEVYSLNENVREFLTENIILSNVKNFGTYEFL